MRARAVLGQEQMEIRLLAIGQELGQEQGGQEGSGQERRPVRRLERGRGLRYRRALALVKLGPGALASPLVFASAKRAPVKRAQVKPGQLASVKRKPNLSKTVPVRRRVVSRGWQTSAYRPKRPDRWRMEAPKTFGPGALEA